jgi:hypothetical protein
MIRINRATVRGKVLLVLIITALAGAGCAKDTPTIVPPDYHLSYNLPLQDRDTLSRPLNPEEVEDLSAKIYLLSDNQRHELLGGGANWFRNSLSDRVVANVAIRPPQLDLFGQDLIREALGMVDGFVLHLGDACDVSNTGEFGRFAWDMQLAPQGWVMAPGNHDGFFFGNSSRTKEDLIREWDETGEAYDINGTKFKSGAMQKDRFVGYYLASLILQDGVWSGQLARALDAEGHYIAWTDRKKAVDQEAVSFTEFWGALEALQDTIYNAYETNNKNTYFTFELPAPHSPIDHPHLRRVAWQIDKVEVWRSFILQEVDISDSITAGDPVSILVLDTSQYGVQPSIDHGIPSGIANTITFGKIDFQMAGKHGNILHAQESAAQKFTSAMQGEGRRWILASHHPYSDLGRATPTRFNGLRVPGGIPISLSGHTHSGEIRLNVDKEREDHFLEINVGSLLDSPVEFRDLQIHRVNDRLAVSSNRQLMENRLRDEGLLAGQLPGYRPSPGDADYFLDYRDGAQFDHDETDFQVKRLILATYLRMFRLFEADHADQSATWWPVGADGTVYNSDKAVTDAIESLLERASSNNVTETNRFIYQLQEFDRTRKFTEEGAQRLRVYRLSQAMWASTTERRKFEGGTDAIDPDISFLILPKSADAASNSDVVAEH